MISDANPDIWEVDVKTISFALLGAAALVVLAVRFAAGQQQQQRPPAFERPPAEDAGVKIFNGQCMTCHGNPAVERAPAPAVIKQMTPERIYEALTTGGMKTQAENLTDVEKRQVAEFMGGRRLGTAQSGDASKMPNRCPSNPPIRDLTTLPSWNGWGVDNANTRYQPAKAADLSVGQVSRLKLKWAFGVPGAISVYGQPTIVNGRVFFSSDSGYVYAVDADSGCVHWSFQAQAGVRSAISIGQLKPGGTKYAAFFGDIHGNMYAVDAAGGELLWKSSVDAHPLARITGAPKLYNGRLYVPVASLEEPESSGLKYPCCTFRGAVAALSAETGKQIWKTYTIAEPATPRKTAAGVSYMGPSGAGVWNSPTIDPKRHAIYFGTGNNFSEPATKTSDAVMALDMETGRLLWTAQDHGNDVWHTGCPQQNFGTPPGFAGRGGRGGRGFPPPPPDYYCPEQRTPDWDMSVSPILITLVDGRSLLIAGQKSGIVWAHDPDKKGAVVWKQDVARIVPGGGGEIVFGGAADDQNVYFNLRSGGVVALQLTTGMEKWYRAVPPQDTMPRGLSAALTLIPGVIFSGGLDGVLRAFSASDGNLLWSFNTAEEFEAVNGVAAKGGSIGGPGPTVAQGMVFVPSGYTGFQGGNPGNVLLAFTPYDRIPSR
jgi:polyvinyl alcohol dehydrogenase (cytochrome)